MNRKSFQEATARAALKALLSPTGSRRYLVADEVGLGKTRVAQAVIEGICRHVQRPKVFYVCSSLNIIRQNRDDLLDFLDPATARKCAVDVDRLTLLPTRNVDRGAPLGFYTLTPGTLPAGRRTGRADERAIIWHLLCESIPGLSRHTTLGARFSRDVKAWDSLVGEARGLSYASLDVRFRGELAAALGIPGAWSTTVIDELKKRGEENPAALIAMCRAALARAGLKTLSPDLIIFDEFQRFFEMLVPGDDDDPISREIVDIMMTGSGGRTPSVLLLSATPYRPFSGWSDGADVHHAHFVKLLEFLYGSEHAPQQIAQLQKDLREYRDRLQRDLVGSREVFGVRDRIVGRLQPVMSRVERPREIDNQRRLQFRRHRAQLRPEDIRWFRHLAASANPADRPQIPSYWLSIPFPLQTMDASYKLMARHAPEVLPTEARRHVLAYPNIRRYEPPPNPHPKLRGLREIYPEELLALPWMPPTLPWWQLGGVFGDAARHDSGKLLLFSRYRAIPRAIACYLSYEAERFAYSVENQRKRGVRRTPYDYRSEPGAKPLGGLKKRPTRSFVFPLSSRRDVGLNALVMFAPLPELARLGDPLTLEAKDRKSFESAIAAVATRIRQHLGIALRRGKRRSLPALVARIERAGAHWEDLIAGLQRDPSVQSELSSGQEGGSKGLRQAVQDFQRSSENIDGVSERELNELAELAVVSPGNVLYRAVQRVFETESDNEARLAAVWRVSVRALAPYLDHPDFHVLLRSRKGRSHPEAVRRAIWDGNLESVLDEYLSAIRGLGVAVSPANIALRALCTLEEALSVGSVSVWVRETGKPSGNEKFAMRCHAALPLGLSREEVAPTESGLRQESGFRQEFVRKAFNSPFRPHVLASTSIGQEGLNFHVWCDHVLHWDLPTNPVDLEQRDGRVDRYAGLAIRKALASSSAVAGHRSPWQAIAAAQTTSRDELSPWWVLPGSKIRRSVVIPPFSRMEEELDDLLEKLALYRIALGQSDQEVLVNALKRRVSGDDAGEASRWLDEARIDLSPPRKYAP